MLNLSGTGELPGKEQEGRQVMDGKEQGEGDHLRGEGAGGTINGWEGARVPEGEGDHLDAVQATRCRPPP